MLIFILLISSLLGDMPEEKRTIDYCSWIELNHYIDEDGDEHNIFYFWDGPGRTQMIGSEDALPNNKPDYFHGYQLGLKYTDWKNNKRTIYTMSFVETYGEPVWIKLFEIESGEFLDIYASRGLSEPTK